MIVVPTWVLVILINLIIVLAILVAVALHVGRRPARGHYHFASRWDGYYETCRCGVSAGDMRDEHGRRYISFGDWPEAIRHAS